MTVPFVGFERLRIVALTVLAAVAYGVVHDQITVRVCLEYFTVAHPPLFPTTSPTLLGLCWGIAATWWMGLGLGAVLAAVSTTGPAPFVAWRELLPLVLRVLALMAGGAVLAGVAGYAAATRGWIELSEPWTNTIPAEHHARFIAAGAAHLASYALGLAAGLWLVRRIWIQRERPRFLSVLPQGRSGWLRLACLLVAGAAIYWWRH